MDRASPLTAREIVNEWSEEALRRILFDYGEERYAPAIAKKIVTHMGGEIKAELKDGLFGIVIRIPKA